MNIDANETAMVNTASPAALNEFGKENETGQNKIVKTEQYFNTSHAITAEAKQSALQRKTKLHTLHP